MGGRGLRFASQILRLDSKVRSESFRALRPLVALHLSLSLLSLTVSGFLMKSLQRGSASEGHPAWKVAGVKGAGPEEDWN